MREWLRNVAQLAILGSEDAKNKIKDLYYGLKQFVKKNIGKLINGSVTIIKHIVEDIIIKWLIDLLSKILSNWQS